MPTVVDLEDPKSWPQPLLDYLERTLDLFVNWERQKGADEPIVSARDFDFAIAGLWNALQHYALVGWHCTRLTEAEIVVIAANGMTPPNGQFLGGRITALEHAGVITSQIAARLRAENQADDDNRAGRIWFCFFPPHVAGERGIGRLVRSWGGEALYNSHEDDAQTGPVLATIGVPCLVEGEVPIAALPVSGGLSFKIYARYLASRGHHFGLPLDHQDRAIQPLPATSIRRVIRHPHAEFVRLTRCDQWRKPLS